MSDLGSHDSKWKQISSGLYIPDGVGSAQSTGRDRLISQFTNAGTLLSVIALLVAAATFFDQQRSSADQRNTNATSREQWQQRHASNVTWWWDHDVEREHAYAGEEVIAITIQNRAAIALKDVYLAVWDSEAPLPHHDLLSERTHYAAGLDVLLPVPDIPPCTKRTFYLEASGSYPQNAPVNEQFRKELRDLIDFVNIWTLHFYDTVGAWAIANNHLKEDPRLERLVHEDDMMNLNGYASEDLKERAAACGNA